MSGNLASIVAASTSVTSSSRTKQPARHRERDEHGCERRRMAFRSDGQNDLTILISSFCGSPSRTICILPKYFRA